MENGSCAAESLIRGLDGAQGRIKLADQVKIANTKVGSLIQPIQAVRVRVRVRCVCVCVCVCMCEPVLAWYIAWLSVWMVSIVVTRRLAGVVCVLPVRARARACVYGLSLGRGKSDTALHRSDGSDMAQHTRCINARTTAHGSWALGPMQQSGSSTNCGIDRASIEIWYAIPHTT